MSPALSSLVYLGKRFYHALLGRLWLTKVESESVTNLPCEARTHGKC